MPAETQAPALLCEHPLESARRESFRHVCGVCGSFWDIDSLKTQVAYDASYPAERGHFDPTVGALKARTLRRWLRVGKVDLRGKRVCEVGFGGGTCLPLLAQLGRRVYGIETNSAAIDRVRAMGVRAQLLLAETLPAILPEPMDLWLFQDVFEHLPDPAAFLDWMLANSTSNAEILIVLPRADSVSRRIMGRLWVHKLPDHQFHWTREGLLEFMAKRGFKPRTEFFPLKYVSAQMAAAHALHKARVRGGRSWLRGATFAVPFNFGELGLVLKRG